MHPTLESVVVLSGERSFGSSGSSPVDGTGVYVWYHGKMVIAGCHYVRPACFPPLCVFFSLFQVRGGIFTRRQPTPTARQDSELWGLSEAR